MDFSNQKVIKKELKGGSYIGPKFRNAWIENCLFDNCMFEKADFSHIADHGNIFNNTSFKTCKFQRAAIGYKGTRYDSCTFENCNFTGAIFIRGEFNNCHFLNCKLNGLDFNACSFEYCLFEGKLVDVWFRGGYGYSYGDKEFGIAKRNQMLNVSFEKAVLEDLTFSNECDLSTIKLPQSGSYLLFDNWMKRLTYLQSYPSILKGEDEKETEIFINSCLVHAPTQHWYLLNEMELKNEFGSIAADWIIEGLKAYDDQS